MNITTTVYFFAFSFDLKACKYKNVEEPQNSKCPNLSIENKLFKFKFENEFEGASESKIISATIHVAAIKYQFLKINFIKIMDYLPIKER